MKIFGGKLRGVKILKEKIRGAKISVEKNKGYEKRGKGCENILRKFKGCENTRRKFKGCEICDNFPEKTPTGYPDLKMTSPLELGIHWNSFFRFFFSQIFYFIYPDRPTLHFKRLATRN